jgi:hypothetical protein
MRSSSLREYAAANRKSCWLREPSRWWLDASPPPLRDRSLEQEADDTDEDVVEADGEIAVGRRMPPL